MKNRRYKKGSGKGKIVLIAAAVVLLAAVITACSQPQNTSKPAGSSKTSASEKASSAAPTVFLDGTTIGGKDVSGKTQAEALELARSAMKETLSAIKITVKFKNDTVTLSGEDFSAQDVLDKTVTTAFQDRKAGVYELSYVIDLSDGGKKKLEDAATACTVKAENATVASFDGSSFAFTDEKPGVRVDMTKTLASVKQLLSQKQSGDIQAAVEESQPTVTKAYLAERFTLLGSYSTDSSNTENGNSNMALALSMINGTVLNPGDTFSYNDTIGDSTSDVNGYLPAGGISGGILVQMYGGGICQGSSTLYGAILRAGMEIVWRDCHAMPSSYCPIGLDATVDYGNIDFQFKNPLTTPVYIQSWMDGVTLTVNVYGCFPDEWDYVEISSEQTGTEDPLSDVEFVTDYNLEAGQYIRRSSGNIGYSASAWRSYYKNGELQRTEELPSSYYEPTGPTYAVGPNTNTDNVDRNSDSGYAGTW